jgi:hypothetical protein
VNLIIKGLADELKLLKLWEYSVLAIDAEFDRFKDVCDATAPSSLLPDGFKSWDMDRKVVWLVDCAIVRKDGVRHGCTLNIAVIAAVVSELHLNHDEYRRLLGDMNLQIYRQYDQDLSTILKNIASRVRYEFLDVNGPKRTQITAE